MPKRAYYKILGLPNNASQESVRKAYRKLAMRYHPDKNNTTDAVTKFVAITEAYDILTGKKPAHNTTATRGGTAHKSPTAEEYEARAREARIRFQQQQYNIYLENERYYQSLIQGKKWNIIKFSAIVGCLLSMFILADYFLPHHYEEDTIALYALHQASGFDGTSVSLIQTQKGDQYWVENITYTLYGENHQLYVESSWLFHNPIRIISRGKTEHTPYAINLNFYRLSGLLIALFLVPGFTVLYKRKKIGFTVLYHFSYYGINAILLLYLLTGYRWAHLLTLGFI
ncbi:J domain-containing protein [Crocinitomicaceae bacterium]|nr:J domain-containing protein [Crocinitomicaceae bacterium]